MPVASATPIEIAAGNAKHSIEAEDVKNDQFDFWIEAGRTERHYWRDVWRYRELFFVLGWRDIAVRYKQTVAGAGWAILQPLMSMLIMTVVFGRVAGLPHEGNAPYAVMVFAAMLPWQFVATAVSAAGQSIISNANLVSKVYFPRLIVPLSSVGVAVADLLVSLSVLAGLMAWYHFSPTVRIAMLPALILLAVIAAIGPSLLITALTVRYRDVRFVVPFMVQFGLYASPVAYSTSVVYDKFGKGWFYLYSLNPMVGVIDGFRWSVIGDAGAFHATAFVESLVVSALLFIGGVMYFRKTERAFADII